MSKYDKTFGYEEAKSSPLIEGETLILSAKPKKSAYILNQIITMMPIAIIWLIFDLTIIIAALSESTKMLFVLIPFFALHLFPVWIWLANILSANKKWQNTKYYITDKRIIVQNGFIGENYQTIYYKDINNVNLRIGLIDKILNVGDIYFDLGTYKTSNSVKIRAAAFLDLENSKEIYSKLQKIVMDIQTDIEYPNALRPEKNPGYNTKYDPKV